MGDLKKPVTQRAVAVDLFCGIGGLTYGLERAGIPVVAGVDIDSTCAGTYNHNTHSRFICDDIRAISAHFIRALYPQDCIKVLVGCAPCQPFSSYSQRYIDNRAHDDKWKLLNSFSRIIEELLPDVISMENVPQLSKETVFENFLNTLKKLDYFISWRIVNAAEYGVPQERKRLVLLASRFGQIKMINPEYAKPHFRTVRQAINELPPIDAGGIDISDPLHRCSKLSEKNILRIRQSIPGGTWEDWDVELKLRCHQKKSGRSYKAVYGRMEWDKPAPTITTQFYGYGNGRFGHPEQDRALSLREGALLQSFPLTYDFLSANGKFNMAQLGEHIGNAVPVLLAEAIGKSITSHIRGLTNEKNINR